MFSQLISYVPSIVGLSVVGLAVLLTNAHDRLHQLFGIGAFVIAAWLLALFAGDLVINYDVSLWAVRVAAAIGTFITPSLLYFAVYFPVKLRNPRAYFHALVLIPAIVFSALCFTPWMIPAVELQRASTQPTNLNGLYTAQTLYLVGGLVVCFAIMLQKRRYVAARERSQILLVTLGLLFAVAVNVIVGFALELSHQANNYSNLAGSLSFLAFVGTTAYAIVRHQLFDLRLAIVRTLGFVLTIGVVSVAYSLFVLGVSSALVTDGSASLFRDAQRLLLFLPPTILAALTFHSLKEFIARHTRNLFYRDSYDTRVVLDKLSDALISDNNLSKIVASGLAVMREALRPSHALFVVIGEGGKPTVEQVVGRSVPQDVDELVDGTRQLKGRIATKDRVPAGQWRPDFDEENISLVLRLGSSKNLVGVLFFGPKRNGQLYTKQDVELLDLSAKNFAVAIENAQKYKQIAEFADTMHSEVLRATANLRRANSKLKTLDSMKDDFISMASHQLRSPAAAIHDAIKMLEQAYLTADERKKIIELAGASSERLLNVVTDMLSVARIQAGHFTIEKSEVDLAELANRALLQASALVNEKHITTHLERLDKPLRLMADRAKMNEIMANYIENAIRYSPEGSQVQVSVRQDRGRAYFEVSDQGIGVPKAERKNLFNKFHRASNARTEHPNGNGIGLFVVRTVVEAHGGAVYYKPLPGGSLFGFWLPSE